MCHLPYGPTAYFNLSHVVMRHDIPGCEKMSEAYPHLIFHNFQSKLGRRATNILKYLFPVPKEESKRVMTFANTEDLISFRYQNWSLNYPFVPFRSNFLIVILVLSWQPNWMNDRLIDSSFDAYWRVYLENTTKLDRKFPFPVLLPLNR